MTKRREHLLLRHTNRGLIAILSWGGMLLDGGQVADLLLGTAVVLWLWTPELQALERTLLRRVQTRVLGQVGYR